jgi:ABC transporter substrate binding protein
MKGIQTLSVKMMGLAGIVILLVTSLAGCAEKKAPTKAAEKNTTAAQNNTSQGKYAGKKVIFVDSYHEGYAWSDGVISGIHAGLDNTGVELKFIHLDTKNNPSVEFGQEAGKNAWAEIQAFKPDVVIACDDNAQKYLVVPFMKGGDIPVVFAGINWDASAYKYNEVTNVTGIVEVELPNQVYDLLKGFAKGERIGYVTIDTETERKIAGIYNERFFGGNMKIYWTKTQEEFKTAFVTAQSEVDILFMGNNAGSDVWNDAEMKQFVLDNIKVPTASINDWMAPFTLLTLAKSPKEQGDLASADALSILDGTSPANIPVHENKKGQLMVNLPLADKLGVVFTPSVLKNAVIIDK